MPHVIPAVCLNDIDNKPERDVAAALVEQLPDDAVIYHSYPWIRPQRTEAGTTALQEGETDFVVLHPEAGLLVIEVKGGNIVYDAENRGWYRIHPSGQRKLIQDPFEQARRNTHALEEQVVKRAFPGYKHLPCAFGHAVVFPDCRCDGPLPPGAHDATVLDASDLNEIGERIPEILKQWSRKDTLTSLNRSNMQRLRKGLAPAFHLLPVLCREIEQEEERLVRLTRQQEKLLQFLQFHKRAWIEGVAGSGKTMLAEAQAQRFAEQGLQTLLVCFNRTLAEWLHDRVPERYDSFISVRHFHGLCCEACFKAGIDFAPPQESASDFWEQEAPKLLTQAAECCNLRYDAIVADEGQDFLQHWWSALTSVHADAESGCFYVFYDPAQNLFVDEDTPRGSPEKPYHLPTNCRNTREIARTCGNIRGVEIPVQHEAPSGRPATVNVASTAQDQRQMAGQVIAEWIRGGNLSPAQMVLQTPRNREHSSFNSLKKLAGFPITEDIDEWQAGDAILFTTIRSFKGLEADAVILADIRYPDNLPHFTEADLYVACSRAKHLLTVLAADEHVLPYFADGHP